MKDDLISRQELLKRTIYNPLHVLYISSQDVLDCPSAQQWIPFSERLPEEDGDYLVCYEEEYRKDYGFSKIGIAPYEVDSEHFGVWTEEFDLVSMGSLGTEFVEIDVVAWMPLPEPYEEDANG